MFRSRQLSDKWLINSLSLYLKSLWILSKNWFRILWWQIGLTGGLETVCNLINLHKKQLKKWKREVFVHNYSQSTWFKYLTNITEKLQFIDPTFRYSCLVNSSSIHQEWSNRCNKRSLYMLKSIKFTLQIWNRQNSLFVLKRQAMFWVLRSNTIHFR